jgi:hypothetical protein
MLFRYLTLALSAVALSGCADIFLEGQIERVEDRYASLASPAAMRDPHNPVGTSVQVTADFAFEMADAYAKAARSTTISQDLASAVVLASAASAGLGAINGVADQVLAERAIAGVTAQTVAQRGVPQLSVRALYDGATRHNCVAMAGSLYTRADLTTLRTDGSRDSSARIRSDFAAFLMILVMREIEFRTFSGIARQPLEFSALADSFAKAIQDASELRVGNP